MQTNRVVSYLIIALFLLLIGLNEVSASTYTPTGNLFESTQTNNLFDIANNQIDNFASKKYLMFQIDDNYYLVVADNFNINSSRVTLANTTILSAVRTSSGYNYYYVYNSVNESSTTVNLNYVVIGNINTRNVATGKRFEEYRHYLNIKNIGIFILGICFAIFVTKERKF